MLEALEVVSGLVLMIAYLILTVFLPISLLAVVLYAGVLVVDVILRVPLGMAGTALSLPFRIGRKAEANRTLKPARWQRLLLSVVPWAVTIAALLFFFGTISQPTGQSTLRPTDEAAGGWLARSISTILGYYAELQDRSMRFWAGLSLSEALEKSSALGPDAFAFFSQRVATNLYNSLHPAITLLELRWLLAATITTIVLIILFIGRPKLGREE